VPGRDDITDYLVTAANRVCGTTTSFYPFVLA
jgi:hypothetical protein